MQTEVTSLLSDGSHVVGTETYRRGFSLHLARSPPSAMEGRRKTRWEFHAIALLFFSRPEPHRLAPAPLCGSEQFNARFSQGIWRDSSERSRHEGEPSNGIARPILSAKLLSATVLQQLTAMLFDQLVNWSDSALRVARQGRRSDEVGRLILAPTIRIRTVGKGGGKQ